MGQNRVLGAFVFFAVAVLAGYFAGGRSWNGVVYLTDGTILSTSRHPAAIKRELDFSRLDGAELITATQKRLVAAAKVVLNEDSVGVELGHFVTRTEDGQRRLACDSMYNRLTLHFEAEGIASAGEKPEMEIDGPCSTSRKDISSIEPIWIPVNKILETRAVDADVDFNDGVKFHFENMSGDWPVSWSLKSVRLYNDQEKGHEIDITQTEMREIRKKPLVVNWMDARRLPSAVDSNSSEATK